MTIDAKITGLQQLGPFKFRWPDTHEDFEGGWDFQLNVGGAQHRARLGIGARLVYERWRVHTVTWLDGAVQVEGVEADDYPASQALISQLKRADRKVVRSLAEVPQGYEGFELVDHRSEIDARYSPYSIAVKIREDDLRAWAVHAWLRMNQRKLGSVAASPHPGADAGLTRP